MHRIDSWGDLRWYFGSSLGVGAQSYQSSGGSVFDDLASHWAHMRKRFPEHRRDVNRHTRIESRLGLVSGADRETLRLGFYPWGSEARASFSFRESMIRNGTCIAALVLRSTQAQRAFGEAHDADVTVPESIVLSWLDSLSKRPNGAATLRRLADGAERELVACVARYDHAAGFDIDDEASLRAALGVTG